MTDCILSDFIVAIDTREQAPFPFLGYKADARQSYKPLIIRTEQVTLRTGDYSIVGFEDRIAIERKSLEDAFSTFSQHRERFERELARLNELEFAGVVIEASWGTILHRPPSHTKFLPKSVWRSIEAWEVRFPRVHWHCLETRWLAERKTFGWLRRFWNDEQEKLKQQRAMEKAT